MTEITIDDRLVTGDLIFAICSLTLSFFLRLLVAFNQKLRSLTYDFLMCVFISEVINSIGNIIEYSKVQLISCLLIPLSDMFTMTLFCFFVYCSCEQLIKSNKNIKKWKLIYIAICAGIALIYGVIIFIVFKTKEKNDINFYFYGDSELNYIRFIHVGLLFLMSGFISYKTYNLLKFLKEKQSSDSANSWKIAILIKTLFRFPIICILYWLFFIIFVFISQIGEYKIKYLIKLFAKAFLGLRGFLIGLNTIQTNKIQILIEKIIEVHIKHNFILKFNLFGKKKKNKK
jgi:hypothetical protein